MCLTVCQSRRMKMHGFACKRGWFLTCLAGTFLSLPIHKTFAAKYEGGPTRSYTNLQAVANVLAPGDVMEVDGDATYLGGVTLDKSGTESNPIIVRGRRGNGKKRV